MSTVPNLNLAQFKKRKREFTEEQLQQAIDSANRRYMEPGILHDVKISGIVKDSVKLNERNPTWVQFGLEFENASSEFATMYFMLPLGQNMDFIGKDGKVTSMPVASFGNFMACMGLTEQRLAFLDKIVDTNCGVLSDLIGFQCRLMLKWNKKKVHGQFDSEHKVWYLVDSEGKLICEEPFQLPGRDEVEKPELRWAEMAQRALEEGFSFESSPTPQLFNNPGVRNPIEQLGLSQPSITAEKAMKVAAQNATSKSVAKISKPVITKKVMPPPEVEETEEEEISEEEFETED